mmetsp:Transcript_36922/g.86276  ORF Transcript_36922/g.86276 Transcript_36922/m.86276 type:complete len:205 (+) Transcript_36922:371-985(+)
MLRWTSRLRRRTASAERSSRARVSSCCAPLAEACLPSVPTDPSFRSSSRRVRCAPSTTATSSAGPSGCSTKCAWLAPKRRPWAACSRRSRRARASCASSMDLADCGCRLTSRRLQWKALKEVGTGKSAVARLARARFAASSLCSSSSLSPPLPLGALHRVHQIVSSLRIFAEDIHLPRDCTSAQHTTKCEEEDNLNIRRAVNER